MRTYLLPLMIFLSLQAPAQQWEWVNPSNNIYFYDTLTFPSIISRDSEGNFYASSNGIYKYDSYWNLLWADTISATTRDISATLSRVVVTGNFKDTLKIAGSTWYYPGFNFLLAAYDTAGNHLWHKIFQNAPFSYFKAGNMILADDNFIYLSAEFSQPFVIGTDSFASHSAEDLIYLRFDANGDLNWWSQPLTNSYDTKPNIGVDAGGNIYVCGTFRDSLSIGGFQFESGGHCGTYEYSCGDILLAKYDAAGALLWAQKAGQEFRPDFVDMEVSPEGNIFLAGTFMDSIFFGDLILTDTNHPEIYIVKYDHTGESQWGILSESLDMGGQCNVEDLLYLGNGTIYLLGKLSFDADACFLFGSDTLCGTDPYYTSSVHMFVAKLIDVEPLSVPNISNTVKSLIVFPNPSRGLISIQGQDLKNTNCTLYDLTGKKMLQCKGSDAPIDLSTLPKGIYILSLQDRSQKSFRKIVLN